MVGDELDELANASWLLWRVREAVHGVDSYGELISSDDQLEQGKLLMRMVVPAKRHAWISRSMMAYTHMVVSKMTTKFRYLHGC